MYTLLAIDSTLRIIFAMAVLFVLVPRLCGTDTPVCAPDRQECLSHTNF